MCVCNCENRISFVANEASLKTNISLKNRGQCGVYAEVELAQLERVIPIETQNPPGTHFVVNMVPYVGGNLPSAL